MDSFTNYSLKTYGFIQDKPLLKLKNFKRCIIHRITLIDLYGIIQ